MKIKTDSKSVSESKDTESCIVFNIFKLLASEDETLALKNKYEAGNFGYGEAKQMLFDLICVKFKNERVKFNNLMKNKSLIDKELKKGAKKASLIANKVLLRVRENIGY